MEATRYQPSKGGILTGYHLGRRPGRRGPGAAKERAHSVSWGGGCREPRSRGGRKESGREKNQANVGLGMQIARACLRPSATKSLVLGFRM